MQRPGRCGNSQELPTVEDGLPVQAPGHCSPPTRAGWLLLGRLGDLLPTRAFPEGLLSTQKPRT